MKSFNRKISRRNAQGAQRLKEGGFDFAYFAKDYQP
jgi:hypothetical protein